MNPDTAKFIIAVLIGSVIAGFVVGFTRACTAEVFNNDQPVIVYYTPTTQGVTND